MRSVSPRTSVSVLKLTIVAVASSDPAALQCRLEVLCHGIMTLDLTDDEKLALVAHLRHALEYDPFPYAPRLDPLKAILAKLEPPQPQPEPLPSIKAGVTPRRG